MRKIINYFVILQILALLPSCGNKDLYDEQFEIKNYEWPKENAISFKVDVPDSTTTYNFYLTIRHTSEYKYNNIFFFLNTYFPNGNKTRDTLECILANDEGKWLGKGWGNIKEDEILLNNNMRFPVSGTYEFYFIQAMREDTLKDIVSLGLKITETK